MLRSMFRKLMFILLFFAGFSGCEAELGAEDPMLVMSGLDIHLPDGGATLLDAPADPPPPPPPQPAAGVDVAAPTAPAVAVQTAPFEAQRAVPLPPADDPHFYERRYHVAWMRVTMPVPDGKGGVQMVRTEFERQLGGEHTWKTVSQETRTR
jgi:hypothetical protein